jgi:hypothetical protein
MQARTVNMDNGAMRRALAFAIVVLGAACRPEPATQPSPQRAAVQASVASSFDANATVRVFINLRESLFPGMTAEERKTALRAAQERVLSALGASFVVTRRFENVPALAGALSRDGLDLAASHPDVASIQMDNASSAQTR